MILTVLGVLTSPTPSLAIPEGPKAVHQYWNYNVVGSFGMFSFHFPPAWSNQADRGVAFYAFDYQANGTKPVRHYWDTKIESWSCHLPPAWDNEEDRGLAFYAFSEPGIGGLTKAVHRYYDHPGDNYFWTTHLPPAWNNEDDNGTVFYAYPNEYCFWPRLVQTGQWVTIGTSTVPTDYKIESGTKTTRECQRSESWSKSVTSSVQAGFSFKGIGGMKHVHSSTITSQVSQSFSQTFEQWQTTTWTNHFEAGTYWQFQFILQDTCGGALAKGHYVANTSSASEEPCCLPGYSVSPFDYTKCTSPSATLPHCAGAAGS